MTPDSTFDPVESRVDFPDLERRLRDFWNAEGIFARSVTERPEDNPWVFYEGPPTANGLPHMGHVVQRTLKDLYPRYKTMRGHRVVRKAGWDTHGLPVEIEVEKQLGLTGKQQIEAYGIAAFNHKCRESVFKYVAEWTEFTNRLGYWVDLDNPYVTYQSAYMESVWAILKRIWDAGLLYQGYRVVPYCPRCATPLSSHELSLGYQDDIKDPSVYPLFELADEPGTYFVAWTTTPWTLPGNVALAVGPDISYVKVKNGERTVIIAEERLDVLEGEYEILESVKGKQLAGKRYKPLYTYLVPEGAKAFLVLEADFVDVAEGTGIVHTAAAYGEDDLRLCQEQGILVRHTVDLRGRFLPEVEKFAGMFVKDADVPVMIDLSDRGLLYKKGTIRHTYPFCWRCDTPLLYYAMETWFIRMSDERDQLLAVNRETHWHPEHIRDGRMGNWLENLQDWSLSRLRYWGTPLPIWVCDDCGKQRCVGSVEELGMTLDDDLHRPHIDEVKLKCEECGGQMTRIPDLIDVWFDSGSMPFAQYHWPFENEATVTHQFPADFICEGMDQTRGWFYSLMAIATLMKSQNSYRNCMVHGTVLDKDGKKMSKRLGNVADPMPLMDRFGADALRWYIITAATIGNDYRFSDDAVQDVVRRFLLILWNTYSFFVTYANIDGYVPNAAPRSQTGRPLLDRWLLSELNQCLTSVTRALDDFDHTAAGRDLEAFVNDMSTWYVRRSRRRFWKSESDADKLSAYHTLHEALLTTARMLAPFTPFIAEALYRNLNRSAGTPDSVHLDLWPTADHAAIDSELSKEMFRARRIVEMGHRQRDIARIKVRIPLAAATVPGPPLDPELEAVVLDELNIKAIDYSDPESREVVLDTEITRELRLEGLARELVRRIQETRKLAGFNIEDRIDVRYRADGDVHEAVITWGDQVKQETLALTLEHVASGAAQEGIFERELNVEGHDVWLGLRLVETG